MEVHLSEHEKELLRISRPVPFSYDTAHQKFFIGDEVVAIEEIPHYGFHHSQGEDLTSYDIDQLIKAEPLVHTHSKIIGMPRFAEYIQSEWSEALMNETLAVMEGVVPAPEVSSGASSDHLGFGAKGTNPQEGRVILQVPGMCACIGPDATDTLFGEKTWESGIFTYDAHNIDQPVQRAALYAGLGHLATRAKEMLY